MPTDAASLCQGSTQPLTGSNDCPCFSRRDSRDVKSQNVVVDTSGYCHLIDLGAARHYRPEQKRDTIFLGTEATAPPELFGYQQTDQRSDIYSLGILLWFLLSGRFDPLPDLPGQRVLCRIIRRCTVFDPKNRYPSAQAGGRVLKNQWLPMDGGAVGLVCAVCLAVALWLSSEAVEAFSLLEAALRQELRLEGNAPIPTDRLEEVE